MKDHLYPEEYKHYQMERLLAKSKGGNPSIHDAAKKINKRKQNVKKQLEKAGKKGRKK